MLISVCGTEGTSLSESMKVILETHRQHFTHLWEGFMGSKQTPRLEPLSRENQCNAASFFDFCTEHTEHLLYLLYCIAPNHFYSAPYMSSLSEIEQLLCRCGGFIYLGTERFMANIPPAKLAALNLSGTAYTHTHTTFSLHDIYVMGP